MNLVNLMKTDVVTTFPAEDAAAAWELMQMKRCHHLVVIGDEGVVGILSERDLGGKNGGPIREGRTVEDLMSKGVVTATPETSLHEAAELMRGGSLGCLPIMEGDRLQGIVTTTDLLKLIAGSSE